MRKGPRACIQAPARTAAECCWMKRSNSAGPASGGGPLLMAKEQPSKRTPAIPEIPLSARKRRVLEAFVFNLAPTSSEWESGDPGDRPQIERRRQQILGGRRGSGGCGKAPPRWGEREKNWFPGCRWKLGGGKAKTEGGRGEPQEI